MTQIQVPSDYVESYQQARRLDQAVADNYIKHALIGDPELDPGNAGTLLNASRRPAPVHRGRHRAT